METASDSRHIIVLRRGQFCTAPCQPLSDTTADDQACPSPHADWFDVLDEHNLPLLTEREVLRNLQAIVADADKLPTSEVARNALGVLTTENRKVWSGLRSTLSRDRRNAACLRVIDHALFVVCLDDAAPGDLVELCGNFLCGTYRLVGGVQVGTCTNRWYDKVCPRGPRERLTTRRPDLRVTVFPAAGYRDR